MAILHRINPWTEHKTICQNCLAQRKRNALPKNFMYNFRPHASQEWLNMAKESEERILKKYG